MGKLPSLVGVIWGSVSVHIYFWRSNSETPFRNISSYISQLYKSLRQWECFTMLNQEKVCFIHIKYKSPSSTFYDCVESERLKSLQCAILESFPYGYSLILRDNSQTISFSHCNLCNQSSSCLWNCSFVVFERLRE